jgi:hypothetical protein
MLELACMLRRQAAVKAAHRGRVLVVALAACCSYFAAASTDHAAGA